MNLTSWGEMHWVRWDMAYQDAFYTARRLRRRFRVARASDGCWAVREA